MLISIETPKKCADPQKRSGMAESVSNQGVARKKCYNGISRKSSTGTTYSFVYQLTYLLGPHALGCFQRRLTAFDIVYKDIYNYWKIICKWRLNVTIGMKPTNVVWCFDLTEYGSRFYLRKWRPIKGFILRCPAGDFCRLIKHLDPKLQNFKSWNQLNRPWSIFKSCHLEV